MFFDNINDARTFALIEVGEELFEPVSYNDRDFSDEELERASSVDVIDTETGEVKDGFGYFIIPENDLYNN